MPNVFVTAAPPEWTSPAHEGAHGRYADKPALSAGPLALRLHTVLIGVLRRELVDSTKWWCHLDHLIRIEFQ
eukprot:3860693-Alexandrium_andersonii.AAC.1